MHKSGPHYNVLYLDFDLYINFVIFTPLQTYLDEGYYIVYVMVLLVCT